MTCNADALETLLFNQRSAARPGSFEHRLHNAGVERGGGVFPPPFLGPAWARPVRGGRGLLKGPHFQSHLQVLPPSFLGPSLGQTQERRVGYTHPPLDTHRCANLRLTTLLPRSQPRPDPGERSDVQRWRRLTVAQLNLRIKKKSIA